MLTTPTLHLGLFFDGTGLNLYNCEPGASGKSNVARLFELYPPNQALYIEGVGTGRGEADDLLAQATGRGASGVAARVAQVPGLLLRVLADHPGSTPIELDLFGFSRGATAVRHLLNDLGPLRVVCGSRPLRVNFVGLFDTVGSIIAPLKGNFSAANADFDGLRLQLRPEMARQIVHLVAADERRLNFPLVAGVADLIVPGDHCDIGGGYRVEVQESLVLERPFSSTELATRPLEQARAWQLARECLEQRWEEWQALGLEVRLESESSDLSFVPGRDIQREKRVRVSIRGERQVRGELSMVYLHLIHGLALKAGVPFDAVPDVLPEELQGIAAKLMAGDVGLEPAELALLRRRYIHLSANWNAPLQSDSPLLDVLFINRPTADGQRVIHANPRP
ncbi:T6SS phospholipase effector Tle1-like catalytic domain-containing protein [Pseudomonas wadenswilerensis]